MPHSRPAGTRHPPLQVLAREARRALAGALALAVCAVLVGAGPARWDDLVAEGRAAGVPETRVAATVQRLADAGFTVAQGAAMLEPVFETARAGLPPGPVLAKVDEGALKRVSSQLVAGAARNRAAALASARDLLRDAGFSRAPGDGGGVLVSVALALESGLPAPALEPVVAAGRGKPFGQVKAVVEAGETLHLAGVAPDTARDLMLDFLERNLRRPEVFRAVRWARERHRDGLAGDDLRRSVWEDHRSGRGHGAGAKGGGPSRGGRGGTGGGMGGHRSPGGGRR